MRSFPLVQQLATRTETQLMEHFLTAWWPTEAGLGPPPNDPDAIALLRLVVQAQTPKAQRLLVDAFGALQGTEQRRTLALEMALTGCSGQQFERSPQRGGPALLIYYSPAFLRQSCLCTETAKLALGMLAETYRAARALFPLGEGADEQGHGVTVRIDVLKAAGTADDVLESYEQGTIWVLHRKSALEAVVERHTQDELPQLLGDASWRVLRLWKGASYTPRAESEAPSLPAIAPPPVQVGDAAGRV